MKEVLYWLTVFMGLVFVSVPASARPQLHTQSIGWIDVSDITCEPTSDHTCVVKQPAPAFTYPNPATTIRLNANGVDADQRRKYQVISGT